MTVISEHTTKRFKVYCRTCRTTSHDLLSMKAAQSWQTGHDNIHQPAYTPAKDILAMFDGAFSNKDN